MEGTASVWMDGRIFRMEKRTRGSTALKQCLTEDLILFSNLREILPIQGYFKIYVSSFGIRSYIYQNQ